MGMWPHEMPWGPFPARGQVAALHTSADAEPQGLPPTLRAHWAAGALHSGLKQGRSCQQQ